MNNNSDFFGGNMRVDPLKFSSDNAKLLVEKPLTPVSCPKELWCNFAQPCRWHHSEAVDLHFVNGTGVPDKDLLEVITGTNTLPGKMPNIKLKTKSF